MNPLLRAVVVLSHAGLAACATPDFMVGKANYSDHTYEYDHAVQFEETGKLRAMCAKPKLVTWPSDGVGMIFKPWPNVPLQKKACATLETTHLAARTEVMERAQKRGGGACLASLQEFFDANTRPSSDPLPWETEEAQRTALAPAVDHCVAGTEKELADGKAHAVALAYLRHGDAPALKVLGAGPRQRLATALATAKTQTIEGYASAAKAATRRPYAAALFLAAESVFHVAFGDTATGEARRAEARALVGGVPVEKLAVSLQGEGPAAAIVQNVSGRVIDSDLVISASAPVRIELTLSAPSIRVQSGNITLHASRRVQRGTRTNPEWTNQKENCDRVQRAIDHAEDNCRRHGSNNTWCNGLGGHQKDMRYCQEKLGRFKQSVPAFVDEDVPYAATQHSGEASGSMTWRSGKAAPVTLPVSTGIERVAHAAVPAADVSGVQASPVSPAEVAAAYQSRAVGVVESELRALVAKRRQGFLGTATAAADKQEAAEALVAFAVRGPLESGSVQALDEKLGLPCAASLSVLLGRP